MKGINYMQLVTTIIFIIVVFVIAFVYWDKVHKTASVEGPKALEGVVAGLVLAEAFNSLRRKGIVLTTTLLATVIFVVIVLFFLLMIYISLTAESGSTSSSFFYGIFDAILRQLPWVN